MGDYPNSETEDLGWFLELMKFFERVMRNE